MVHPGTGGCRVGDLIRRNTMRTQHGTMSPYRLPGDTPHHVDTEFETKGMDMIRQGPETLPLKCRGEFIRIRLQPAPAVHGEPGNICPILQPLLKRVTDQTTGRIVICPKKVDDD